MPKFYKYVGDPGIALRVANCPHGRVIRSITDLQNWFGPYTNLSIDTLVIATFVIDRDGNLRLADRHSEHVACAGGEAVLSAGEMFIGRDRSQLYISEITNQSTGYCPEVESWQYVAAALDGLPIDYPQGFTIEFIFRRCELCAQINIIKDGLFVCAVCGSSLADRWNF